MNTSDRELAQVARALADGRLTINRLDDGSGVVLDTHAEQLLSMNQTGLMIVGAIADGTESEDAIAQQLSDRFAIDLPRAREDVRRFTQRLAGAL